MPRCQAYQISRSAFVLVLLMNALHLSFHTAAESKKAMHVEMHVDFLDDGSFSSHRVHIPRDAHPR